MGPTVDVLNKLGPETGFQKLPAPPIPAKLTAVNTVEDLEAPEQLVQEQALDTSHLVRFHRQFAQLFHG